MAYKYFTANNNLGCGLQEIEFFSKDINYDKELYEKHILKKEKSEEAVISEASFNQKLKHKNLIKIWEEGGPVKVRHLPDFDVYPLYFMNFQEYDYNQLKELLGNFFTLCEFENKNVRVTYRTENDLRICYNALKKDRRYKVWINLDLKGDQKSNVKNNILFNESRDQNLINQWLNKGNVICETSKKNIFPLQIYNYQHLKYNGLMELFSKYGKFISITHLESEHVQVKFCFEDAARNCFKDLREDKHYNVRLLFFLKPLNTKKKLVKEILSCKEEIYLKNLIDAEDKIKFCPSQILINHCYKTLKGAKGTQYRNGGGRNLQPKRERSDSDFVSCIQTKEGCARVVYNTNNDDDFKNIYVEGTPLHNPYLTPPHSYKVWCCKQNYLPPPPLSYDSMSKDEKDLNYEYFLECSRGKGCFSANAQPSHID